MTEGEKQAIRASFAGKRVSQMTDLERQVFDEDFQYGAAAGRSQKTVAETSSAVRQSTVSSLLKRLGLSKS